MKKTDTSREAFHLIGITVRTNNEREKNWETGVIFPTVQRYFHQNLAASIPSRQEPGTTYCAYTDYESDHTGDYTYFIGEVVAPDTPLPEGFERLTIPTQKYAKFTVGPGGMPDVIRNAWLDIWQLTPNEFGGNRRYHTDFEVYDERASDHNNIITDIYIGIH
ncbi:MAG: AraC family transcriptional regulator [Chlamydiia bacterium]|nr:AraC family transcriptional regulator [Chlamydiia bacterium]